MGDSEITVKTDMKAKSHFRVLTLAMGGGSEDELEEVLASFKRVWRSGGRASLSLHASQGELEARV